MVCYLNEKPVAKALTVLGYCKNNNLPFWNANNLNCYPDSTATSKGVRFWLSNQRDEQKNVCLDKSIYNTLLRRVVLANKDG